MNCFIAVFSTTLRQRLARIRGWIVLLLIPCLLLGIRLSIPETAVTAPVQVGIVLPENGADDLWQYLESRSGTVLTFIPSDIDTIHLNIATGKWDCGVVVAEDFSEKLEALDTDHIFTLLVAEGSAVYPLVKETIASCMAGLVSPHIAQKYLDDTGIAADADFLQVDEKLTRILGPEDRIIISMTTVDGAPLAPFELEKNTIRTVLQWVVSATILVWLLLSACELGQWSRSGAALRMLPLRSFTMLTGGRMAADWVLITFCGCIAMATAGGGFSGFVAAISYSLFWSAIGVLLCRFPPVWESLPVLPPFAVVISLLFSGALVDVSLFIPALARVTHWFPGHIFLEICRGQTHYALLLILAAVAMVLICIILDKIKKR